MGLWITALADCLVKLNNRREHDIDEALKEVVSVDACSRRQGFNAESHRNREWNLDEDHKSKYGRSIYKMVVEGRYRIGFCSVWVSNSIIYLAKCSGSHNFNHNYRNSIKGQASLR